MNIKNKLYIGAGISIVLVVILFSLVLVTSGRIAEGNKKHELLDNVRGDVAELDIVTYDYLLYREKRMEQQWNSKYNSLGEILRKSAEEEELTSIRADYAALGDLFSQITANNEKMHKLIQEGASQEGIDSAIGLEERLVAQLLIISHSVITNTSRLAEETQAEVMGAQRLAANLTLILMIVLAIAVTSSSFLVARSISKPLSKLADYSRRVGEGEYTADIEIKGKDEVASVASDVKSMVGQLLATSEQLKKELTERKQAEEWLRFSDTAFLSLRESVVATDTEYTITRWNEVSEEMYGIKASEAIGKKLFDVIEVVETFPGETAKRVKKLETQGYYQDEVLHRTKCVEVWVNVVVQAIEDSEKRYGWVTLATDITERKQAEEALRESEEKMRLTFESVTEGIIVSDLDGNIVQVNEAVVRMHSYDSKEELIGRSAFELIAEKDHAKAMENMKRTLEDGYVKNIEYTFLTRDGSEFPAELSAAVLRDASVNPTGFVAVIRDITERKRMEEQLMVTDRLASVGELASGIAHELNNPLTSVIGFSQLLLEQDIPDDIKQDLEIVCSEAQRAAGVVKNLLTFARKHPSVKEIVNINSIIDKVLELRAYEQKVNNIKVNTKFAPDLPEVMADYFQLQQVFLNIIINAEHFTTEAHNRGTLTITTKKVGNTIKASFADDGPGIAEENLGHVFDPFFTTKEVGKGTGLGLSICHGIITEHDGKIYAESKLGKGATFIVELPISDHSNKGAVK